MFEIIGILVVLFIGWQILKGVFSGSVKGHMLRSVEHAMVLGVPHSFAMKMIQQRDIMKSSVAHMAKFDSNFMLKDVYVQYGEAIAMLYQGYLSEQENR